MTPTLGGLQGLQVVVTRSKGQASDLVGRLRDLGALPVEVATIAIVEPADGGAALATALDRLSAYAWVVLASPNGARAFVAAAVGARSGSPAVACVGPSTAQVMVQAGYDVALVPDRFVAESLVDLMPEAAPGSDRVLLVQAEVSRPVLEHGLSDRGWTVDRVVGYRTIDADVSDEDRAAAAAADVVTFTSSSTVERFVRLVGLEAMPDVVVSIGPITSATARALGVEVAVEAQVHTLDGLVDALVAWAQERAG